VFLALQNSIQRTSGLRRRLEVLAQPSSGEDQEHTGNHRDAGGDEPQLGRLHAAEPGGDSCVVRAVTAEEKSRVHRHNDLGHEPRELGHAHVYAGATFRSDLRGVLEEARLPHGLTHRHDQQVSEQQTGGRPDRKQKCRRRHDEGADDHHVVDLLLIGQCRDDRHKDKNEQGIEVRCDLEVLTDPARVTSGNILRKD